MQMVETRPMTDKINQRFRQSEEKKQSTLGQKHLQCSLDGTPLDTSEAEDKFMQSFNDRKKSHELAYLRCQYKTDENRIKKLSEMPVSRKIAQHREYKDLNLQLGRDDINNILGSHKISSFQPNTTRAIRKKTPNVVT